MRTLASFYVSFTIWCLDDSGGSNSTCPGLSSFLHLYVALLSGFPIYPMTVTQSRNMDVILPTFSPLFPPQAFMANSSPRPAGLDCLQRWLLTIPPLPVRACWLFVKGQSLTTCQRMKLDPYFTPYTQPPGLPMTDVYVFPLNRHIFRVFFPEQIALFDALLTS